MIAALIVSACGGDETSTATTTTDTTATTEAVTSVRQAASIVSVHRSAFDEALDEALAMCPETWSPSCDIERYRSLVDDAFRTVDDLRSELRVAGPFDPEIAPLVDRTMETIGEQLKWERKFYAGCDVRGAEKPKGDHTLVPTCLRAFRFAVNGFMQIRSDFDRWDPYL